MNKSDIAKQLGSMGGKKTLKKYGRNHFRDMVNKRWAKVRAEKAEKESKTDQNPDKNETDL